MSVTAESMSTGGAAPPAGAKSTTLAALRPQPIDASQNVTVGFSTAASFELLQRAGKVLAASTIVPKDYQGNLPNCIIALNMAARIGADPLLVMQNLYIVYGRPGWSAKFLIACFNHCGRFTAVRYLWSGTKGKEDWGCQAWSIEKETGEKIMGPVITWGLAKAEGWVDKSGSKWKTMPEKMFMYRAAAWMIDTHAPEISMGIRTDDEIRDTYDTERGADGQYSVTTESLRQAELGTVAEPAATGSASIEDAIKALRESGSIADLAKAWDTVRAAFKTAHREVPMPVDAAYQETKEKLERLL